MLLPETIATKRLRLRRPNTADAPRVLREFATDPEVTRYVVWSPHADIRDTLAFLEQCDEGWESELELTWALTRPPSDDPIGVIGIRPDGFKADIGYVLGRRHWRQGFMTEAARALVEHAFDLPAMVRIWATCDVENQASARVLEKIGMTREGTLRRWIMHPNLSSEPRDALVYSILRSEAHIRRR